MRGIFCCLFFLITPSAFAADFTCGGIVAPGLAYPDIHGHWAGLEVKLCHKLADRLGQRLAFEPILQDNTASPPATVFLPQDKIPAGYAAGPVIYNDNQALMVPAGSKARNAAELGDAEICVEPGSPEDFNLSAYFAAHYIALREFAFQDPDEMHDAYVAGRCDAITARKSFLIGLRANEDGARRDDMLLPDNLGDHPIRLATSAAHPGWGKLATRIIQENLQ